MTKLSSTLVAFAALVQPASILAAEADLLPVLTNAEQVVQLGRAASNARSRRIDFETVITLPNSSSQIGCWTQEGTNAVWVIPTNNLARRAGWRVRIKGESAPGNSVPIFVHKANMEIVGPGVMPEPLKLPVTHLLRPEFFGRWIEQEGTINNVEARGSYYQMFLAAADLPVDIHFYAFPEESSPTRWKDHRFRMQGVCVSGLDAEGRVFGFEMHVPGTNFATELASVAARKETELPAARPVSAGIPLAMALASFQDAGEPPHSPANATNTLPLLTNVQQVFQLGLDGARSRHHPVRLIGLVTCPVPDARWVYVDDGTGGIQVIYTFTDNLPERRPGQVVWVDGIVGAGPTKPWIAEARLKPLGLLPMPGPSRPEMANLAQPRWHGEWIQIEGVVRDLTRDSTLNLLVANREHHLEVVAPYSQRWLPPLELLDARIAVRGLCEVPVDFSGHPTQARLLLNTTNDLQILSPGRTNRLDCPLLKPNQYRGGGLVSDNRARVDGTVLFHSGAGRIFFRDAVGAVQAELLAPLIRRGSRTVGIDRPPLEPLRPGDRIELIGAPAASVFAPRFVDGEYRKLGSGTAPQPIRVKVNEAASGRRDADLVTLRARVVGRERRTVDRIEHEALLLEDDGVVFEALCEASGASEMPPTARNTKVQVTGICVSLPATGHPENFRLFLRGIDDVQMMGTAAAWELIRPGRILAVSGGLGGLALAWIGLLRRQVGQRRRAEEKARHNESITRTINYFATSLLERHEEEAILWDLARNCVSKLGFVDCVIYLLDQEKKVLLQKAAFGPKNPEGTKILDPINISLEQGIVGSVASSRRAEIVNDTRRDARYILDDEFRHAEICVPIVAGDQLLGVIDSEHPTAGFFTSEHLEILTAIASLCANKLVRVRAETKLRSLNAELEQRVTERTVDLSSANERLQEEVAARQRAEIEVQRALAQEKELGELKSRFVSLVSHEFRTPLGIIMSSAEILDAYLDRLPPEERRANLQDIFRSTKHMAGLMEEVLLLSRVEAGKMTCRPGPLDLEVFCTRVADEVTSATAGRCRIELSAAAGLEPANADEGLLRHILTNLLNNAVKYSPVGAAVQFHVEPKGALALFTVRDRGLGIPETDAKQMYQAFHRGRNVGETPGTGLGMYIVKRCVELHGGKIAFESKEGQGTTFIVGLPLFGVLGNGDNTTQLLRSLVTLK